MLRRANTTDYAMMADIHAASFERGWKTAEIAQLAEQEGAAAYVATAQDAVAGFVLIRCAADECEILTLAVDGAFKRRGIGQALLERVRQHARENAVRRIFLEVAEDNALALALYAKAGYTEHGRRKGYYRRWHGRRVDALLLSRAPEEK